jgi:tetratricopeptide (TPR) repeat protein
MEVQTKPRSVQDLHSAVSLYDRALALCSPEEALLMARLQARKGTALNAIPHEGPEFVEQARRLFESALSVLCEGGTPEEVAEAEMNLGLALQTLAATGRARMADAIGAYLRALRTFTREAHPAEFAILHNNLAAAYLSLPMSEPSGKVREALAVQSFEEALKVVPLVDQPAEYAMLQNNLGNALQYASSSHSVENNLRALVAYDEALKVRNPKDTPVEYANTISNKANALRNLPDDPSRPEDGNRRNLRQALQYLNDAKEIFERFGDATKVRLTQEILGEIRQELEAASNGDALTSGKDVTG